jgi:hypothetical protein
MEWRMRLKNEIRLSGEPHAARFQVREHRGERVVRSLGWRFRVGWRRLLRLTLCAHGSCGQEQSAPAGKEKQSVLSNGSPHVDSSTRSGKGKPNFRSSLKGAHESMMNAAHERRPLVIAYPLHCGSLDGLFLGHFF